MLPEAEIRIGKCLKAWDKTLYPVFEVSTLKTGAGGVQASWIVPLAVLVVEPEGLHAVSLTGAKITVEKLLDLAPALQEVVDGATGVRRIRVS